MSANHFYGKPGNSEENSNGMVHPGGNFLVKKSYLFPVFTETTKNENFLYHLFGLPVPGFNSRESEKFTSIL